MKKIILAVTALMLATVLNAQSLEDIVKKYSAANKLDKISSLSTIKITAKMSMMGMELPMEMWMKNPDKIKTVTNMNGSEIISVFDGVKGYTINPMAGGQPVEMTPEQIKQTMNSNYFQNNIVKYLKNGQLALEGEEIVKDKPAYKIKASLEGGNIVYMCIDKSSFLMVKTSATVSQQGQTINVDSYPTDYADMNGVFLPRKTNTSAGGMDIILTFDKVEVNIPMEDSVFKVK